MKKTIYILVLVTSSVILSCKKDYPQPPPNYNDGVDPGEDIHIGDGTIDNTFNMEGGDATISGDTYVSADINVKDSRSELLIKDSVNLHKINLNGGTVRLVGSPVIRTDFNVNDGTVHIGSAESSIYDTVRILNNLNLHDTLWVDGGVLVVEKDFNQSSFVNIANNAKVIVLHDFNKGGDLYGKKNLSVKGAYNNNNVGITSEEPFLQP